MRPDLLLLTACGIEDDGESVRVYVDGPTPEPSYTRDRGIRSDLFHLFSGEDAATIRGWLRQNRAWDCLRVPSGYTRDRGVRAIQVAFEWHSGGGSPLYQFASTRRVHDDAHRERAYREVGFCIRSVIENPVGGHEYADLRLLAEVILTAPLGVELVREGSDEPEDRGGRR
jgi:hypothetical protein